MRASKRLAEPVVRNVEDTRTTEYPEPTRVGSLCPATVTVAASIRVQGATAYPLSAASARVRIAAFRPFLAVHGVDLLYESTLSDDDYALVLSSAHPLLKARALGRSLARAARPRDREALYLVHRLLTLTPLPGIDPPRHIDAYDFDDALTIGSAADTNRRFQWIKQEAIRARACMRRARLVIAANRTLASEALKHAGRVEIVPSCVDPESQPVHTHSDERACVIGWIGSQTTLPYLDPVLGVVERLHGQGYAMKLVVVGADSGLRREWIEHRRWSLTSQAADLAGFDIGVMPLPDTAWTRGKAGYKLLQYFAAGVPAVGSPVGMNCELLAEGHGIAATSPREWEQAFHDLMADATSRRERGEAARRYVQEHFSYQRWAPELANMLQSLA